MTRIAGEKELMMPGPSHENRPMRTLIVDDQAPVRSLLNRLLTGRGHRCVDAANAEEALAVLGRHQFDLMLSDVHMPPGKSGLELIETARQRYPDMATIMVTAEDDPRLADVAIQLGAYGYVLKPFQASQLIISISNAMHRQRLETENRMHREHLERTVADRTRDLREALARLQLAEQALRTAHDETVIRLMRAAEFRDNETAQHIQRMCRYAELMARLIGMEPALRERIRDASAMHDIGKIGTPDQILLKAGRLQRGEFHIMKQHAEIGYRILQGTGVPVLEMGAMIAYTHHEKFDGSGYPRGLAGEAIPIEGRITAICDVFDALISRRVYKEPYPLRESLDFMRSQSGSHFDPELLHLFIDNVDAALVIKRQFPDD
jgi:putative two-component system response regulator